ncbi:MAG: UvrD/REP helicase [Hyperionvirus sp.]|uniref:UvrD/REP helicase n=1 Tax=Hyperionvirus sp. TaxID=2487770 RepID=A0A3G5ABW5_9VIRU|nr:MAG: UvrD/REP helicase [Hyperionvirus sp.]
MNIDQKLFDPKCTVKEMRKIMKDFVCVRNADGKELVKKDLLICRDKLQIYCDSVNERNYRKFNFGDEVVELNDEQYKIVVAKMTRNMRIIACAGSGKSTTMLCRIKYLIDMGELPTKILLLTFNKAAQMHLQKKLVELFTVMVNVTVRTIDSFSCAQCYKNCKVIPGFSSDLSVREYAPLISKFMNTADGKAIAKNYRFVFFDEFQDVSEDHFNIIKCFANEGCVVTVIGDDAQNIYSFRGTNVSFILNFDKYIPNVDTYMLTVNYRSTPEIIEMANASISFNEDQIKKSMVPYHKSVGIKPNITVFRDYEEQNREILNEILKYAKRGVAYDKIAVISNGNKALNEFESSLAQFNRDSKNDIPYVSMISDENSKDFAPKSLGNHLTLTTIHKAKGLEWLIVFIIGCGDKYFPKRCDAVTLQEERRLFYVGVTRAKEELFLACVVKELPFTRFVGELPKGLYEFTKECEQFGNIFGQINNERKEYVEYKVTDIIRQFRPSDISFLRENNMIPQCHVEEIHGEYEHDEMVNKYYLHADFGEFIDRYLTRKFMEQDRGLKSYDDLASRQLLYSIQLKRDEYNYFISYLNPAYAEFDMENNFSVEVNVVKLFEFLGAKLGVGNVERWKGITLAIMVKAKEVGLMMHQVQAITCNYLPGEFKKEKLVQFEIYKNVANETDKILREVYEISLASNILEKRRRLLYRSDVYESFVRGRDDMFRDMKCYVDAYEGNKKRVRCKQVVRHTNGVKFICGELDLLNLTDGCVIDFKCSCNGSDNIDWFLQMMAYKVLFEYGGGQKIGRLQVYNPLRGKIFTYDVADWDKHEVFISLMYRIIDRMSGKTVDQ